MVFRSNQKQYKKKQKICIFINCIYIDKNYNYLLVFQFFLKKINNKNKDKNTCM